MINIERSILCSILEHNFINNDKKIVSTVLDANLFQDKHHRLFANSINRLRELDKPIDSDMLRLKLIEAKKWDFYMEDSLMKIMTCNPFGSYYVFDKYYKTLRSNHNNVTKIMQLRNI